MNLPRVIPCLLLHSEALVKTQKFQNPNYIGDPINAVKIFNDLEVDELILLNISASKEGKDPDYSHIEEIVSEAFMPVAIGGGIKNIEQAARLINIGVEKIVVNTGAFENMQVIKDISQRFGSQSAVLAIDIKKTLLGDCKVYDHRRKKVISVDLLTHIQNGVKAGAGEVFINFVDQDGLGKGYLYDVISQISEAIEVPLIVCGGAGSLDDISKAVKHGAAATAVGSMFVYAGKHKAVMINYPKYEILKNLFS